MDELIEKGQQALSAGAWEEAKKYFEEDLLIKESPETYELLAWSCWWLNDTSAIFEYRSKAYALYLYQNNKPAASRIASWIGVDYLELKGELPIAQGWLQRAENLLEGFEHTPEFALIKLFKGRLAFMLDKNSELALKLIEESLLLSKSLGSTEGEMIAEALKGFILVTEGKISEGMPLLDDATVMALTKAGDVNMVVNTCCLLIDACHRIRDFERASQWCTKVKEICERWRYKAMFASCRTQYASVLIWRGEWKEAEEELLASAKELKQFRPLQVNSSIIRLAELRRRQGKWEDAENLLNEVDSHRLKLLVCAALAFDKGEYESALNQVERFLRKIPPSDKTEGTEALELLLCANIKLGKLKEASNVLTELKSIEEVMHTQPIRAALLNAEGIYNHAIGKYELAKADLEDAIDIYDKIISPFEAARSRLLLSDVLQNIGQHQQAEVELDSAKKIFKNLGAERDFEKAKLLRKNLYKITTKLKDNSLYNFTQRELEIFNLIAGGKNNEEIAGILFLSVRTVEKHLTNIYQKLGISGKSARAYAVSFAIKNNLITS